MISTMIKHSMERIRAEIERNVLTAKHEILVHNMSYAKEHNFSKDYIEVARKTSLNYLIPVTLWYRYSKDKDGNPQWDYNHLEDGHCQNNVPTPLHPNHKSAWQGKWAKAFAAIDSENKVTHFLIV
jgi:hypothetical protein